MGPNPKPKNTNLESDTGVPMENILRDIYRIVEEKEEVTGTVIADLTHHSYRAVKRYLNLIEFVQTQPLLEFKKLGNYTVIRKSKP